MNPFRIAACGIAEATLVVGEESPEFIRWVAEEFQKHILAISGALLPIVGTGRDLPAGASRILLGTPKEHPGLRRLQSAGILDLQSLGAEGLLLETVEAEGTSQLVVAGNDERGVMYAAYELLERLGIVFQLTGDILPEPRGVLEVAPMSVRMEPAIRHRGFHMRHFVMPWMGYEDFCRMVDQMAKMKCNYLEFYWYEGAPWIEYECHGVKRTIGDLYSPESGYLAWRSASYGFTADDVLSGREDFPFRRPCAMEFQDCRTAEDAHRVAQDLLARMIRYSHSRNIEFWLGAGDCPTVPPNLGRLSHSAKDAGMFGFVVPPGDPLGVEIWTAVMESMAETYPEADGIWLWLAESYFDMGDPRTVEVLRPYDDIRELLPTRERLAAMGYDQYLEPLDDARIALGDLSLLHYARSVVERVRSRRPHTRLGVSLLGRSYLFPALDALLPPGIRLQSMEAATCWNRRARVPMENFAGLSGRETFLVPRLDDDENALAMQFNVGLYDHDRVLEGSTAFGISGIAPQIGKLRGSEPNAMYLSEGCWGPHRGVSGFYSSYAERVFGLEAGEVLADAFRKLDALELDLGLRADAHEAGPSLQGMGNFLNYADSRDIHWLKSYRHLLPPVSPAPADRTDAGTQADSRSARSVDYRLRRFEAAILNLEEIHARMEKAHPLTRESARAELEFILAKTMAFIHHLRSCCAVARGLGDLGKACSEAEGFPRADIGIRLGKSAQEFEDACREADRASVVLRTLASDPGERYLRFRHDVRFQIPLREFARHVRQLADWKPGAPPPSGVAWEFVFPEG
jgi:hypothetical protein